MRVAVLLFAGAFASSALAADATNGLLTAKTLKCQLGAGIATTWKNGVPSLIQFLVLKTPLGYQMTL